METKQLIAPCNLNCGFWLRLKSICLEKCNLEIGPRSLTAPWGLIEYCQLRVQPSWPLARGTIEHALCIFYGRRMSWALLTRHPKTSLWGPRARHYEGNVTKIIKEPHRQHYNHSQRLQNMNSGQENGPVEGGQAGLSKSKIYCVLNMFSLIKYLSLNSCSFLNIFSAAFLWLKV